LPAGSYWGARISKRGPIEPSLREAARAWRSSSFPLQVSPAGAASMKGGGVGPSLERWNGPSVAVNARALAVETTHGPALGASPAEDIRRPTRSATETRISRLARDVAPMSGPICAAAFSETAKPEKARIARSALVRAWPERMVLNPSPWCRQGRTRGELLSIPEACLQSGGTSLAIHPHGLFPIRFGPNGKTAVRIGDVGEFQRACTHLWRVRTVRRPT
jgi:hypothetical protein